MCVGAAHQEVVPEGYESGWPHASLPAPCTEDTQGQTAEAPVEENLGS